MSRILVEYERKSPSMELTIDSLNNFVKKYGGSIDAKCTYSITKEDLCSHDILYSIRGETKAAYYIAKIAKQSGLFFCLMMDDDLINKPPFYRYKGRVKYANKIASLADVIKVTNDQVRDDCVKKFSARIVRIDTACKIVGSNIRKRQENIVKIVFAANPDHKNAFESYITPILNEIKVKKKIVIDFIGVAPKVNSEGLTVNYLPIMPLEKYRKHMSHEKYDIGIAVLESNSFTNRKYINKFIEYTIAGVVGIYTNCPLYQQVIVDGVNGFFADNDPQSWKEKILYTIENIHLLNQCLKNAEDYLKSNHNENFLDERSNENVPEMITYIKKPSKEVKIVGMKIAYISFSCAEKIDQVIHYLMHGQVNEIKNKIIQRIKIWESYSQKGGVIKH